MIPYQILVEGVFIEVAGFPGPCGFHTTFFVKANSAVNAVHRVKTMLSERQALSRISAIEHGIFSTYYIVRDIWEIGDDDPEFSETKGSGFSFFAIGSLEKFILAIRHLFLKCFRAWRLL